MSYCLHPFRQCYGTNWKPPAILYFYLSDIQFVYFFLLYAIHPQLKFWVSTQTFRLWCPSPFFKHNFLVFILSSWWFLTFCTTIQHLSLTFVYPLNIRILRVIIMSGFFACQYTHGFPSYLVLTSQQISIGSASFTNCTCFWLFTSRN